MATRKLKRKTTLFVKIEASQHEALRYIAYKEKKFLAEIVRKALTIYLAKKKRRKTA